MLSLFEQLQNGTVSSRSFTLTETTRRVFNLELSNRRDVEPVHTAGVNTMDIEKVDNRYLLSGSNNGAISIHDLVNTSGQVSYTSKIACAVDRNSRYAHDFSVDTVLWYPFDTGLFTSSGMDCKLKIWDTRALKPADTFSLQGKIYGHSMSPIATHHTLIAASLEYPHVILIDMKSGSKCHELRGHKNKVVSVKWSPCAENLLATGGADNKILLWDIRSAKGFLRALDQHNGEAVGSRKDLITAHNGLVSSLCFSSDGLYLLSYGTDSQLRLWDVAACKNTLVNYGKVHNDSRKGIQMDVCYDACIPVVFVPSKSRILMYSMFTGSQLNVLVGHFSAANCCVFRPDHHELYSGGFDRNIMLWTPDVQQELLADQDDSKDNHALCDAWSSDDD